MPFPHVGQDHPAIQWVSASKGYIPENAFRVSGKAIGRGIDVYGGIQPGYISKSKKALVVEHSHQQMLISKYEVLVPARGYSALTENETLFDWIPMSGTLDQTKFNFTPLKGNRDELYIARIWDDGKWIIGKAGNPLPGIHYVASGVAKIGQNYEILAIKSRLDLNKNSISEMKNLNKFALKEWVELISDPIKLSNKNQLVFEHSDLPMVSNELSVTLQLKLQSHISNWATIFHKGR
ncbi:10856_t:CDS:2 [Scutellospora calospora]|uniref:10856_t:CDS:1 n=1 Tax=Scutellospora calospora TaxID=85575 RepID=A0ACA9K764_9GLOM|nr:10856_t:CDS:2 [Scutellospora calospora]